jgi:hypothetical protein
MYICNLLSMVTCVCVHVNAYMNKNWKPPKYSKVEHYNYIKYMFARSQWISLRYKAELLSKYGRSVGWHPHLVGEIIIDDSIPTLFSPRQLPFSDIREWDCPKSWKPIPLHSWSSLSYFLLFNPWLGPSKKSDILRQTLPSPRERSGMGVAVGHGLGFGERGGPDDQRNPEAHVVCRRDR